MLETVVKLLYVVHFACFILLVLNFMKTKTACFCGTGIWALTGVLIGVLITSYVAGIAASLFGISPSLGRLAVYVAFDAGVIIDFISNRKK